MKRPVKKTPFLATFCFNSLTLEYVPRFPPQSLPEILFHFFLNLTPKPIKKKGKPHLKYWLGPAFPNPNFPEIINF